MKLLLWGTSDKSKPRTRILQAAIEIADFDIQEIHSDVWSNLKDKSQLTRLGLLAKVIKWIAAYPMLIVQFLRAPKPDAVLLCYPAQLDTLVLWAFARLRGVPIVVDVFISLFDTIVLDRKLLRENSVLAKTLWVFERLSFRTADRLFIDTEPHARHIEQLFDLQDGSIGSVPVGAEPIFQPAEARSQNEKPIILFYGQMIPLHGISFVLEAALSEKGRQWDWILIGEGQETSKLERLESLSAPHIRWQRWVDYSELNDLIAKADLCLGIFGTSVKAASVVPNKVYQCLAAHKHVVTRDSDAIVALLNGDPSGITTVGAGSAAEIVNGIETAMQKNSPPPSDNLRERFSLATISRALMSLLVAR